MLTGGFGELGLGRGERVLVDGVDGLDARREPLGERHVVESERDAQQGRQRPCVVEVGADSASSVELVQQRLRLLGSALGEQELGGGGKRERP